MFSLESKKRTYTYIPATLFVLIELQMWIYFTLLYAVLFVEGGITIHPRDGQLANDRRHLHGCCGVRCCSDVPFTEELDAGPIHCPLRPVSLTPTAAVLEEGRSHNERRVRVKGGSKDRKFPKFPNNRENYYLGKADFVFDNARFDCTCIVPTCLLVFGP